MLDDETWTVPMLNDELKCQVCGLVQDEPPWGEFGDTATFNICALFLASRRSPTFSCTAVG
jgi:hypothetical protein